MPRMPFTTSTLRAVRRRLADGRHRRRADRTEVCVVGPGKAFLSGMTYHTYGLVTALDEGGPTRAILLRNLVPKRLYPGRDRVGADLSHLRLPPDVRRTDGIDWWWGPGMVEAAGVLLTKPPAVLVVQWWSAAVWHTELALVVLAKLRGARIVIEVHEVMDTAEQRHPLAGTWARVLAPALMAQADRVVVHNRADLIEVGQRFRIPRERLEVIAEPPFDHYDLGGEAPARDDRAAIELLFFGTIRPYKGLEDLVRAFDALCAARRSDDSLPELRLTVVGETWEGWTTPAALIASSPNRERITFVNRYVPDEDVDRWFRTCDLVVLPYRRSSTSGPLMVAMSYGLPVVVTAVGGLPEAVEGYSGAVVVPGDDVERLADGIRKAEHLVGVRHEAMRTWSDVAREHEALYRSLGVEGRR